MIHALKGQYQLPVYFLLVINYQTPDWVRYSISSFQTTGWMEKKSYILLGHQVSLPLRKCLHLFGEMMFHFLLALTILIFCNTAAGLFHPHPNAQKAISTIHAKIYYCSLSSIQKHMKAIG